MSQIGVIYPPHQNFLPFVDVQNLAPAANTCHEWRRIEYRSTRTRRRANGSLLSLYTMHGCTQQASRRDVPHTKYNELPMDRFSNSRCVPSCFYIIYIPQSIPVSRRQYSPAPPQVSMRLYPGSTLVLIPHSRCPNTTIQRDQSTPPLW